MTTRLVSGLAELSPSCKTAVRLQSEALDHQLTWRQQLGLRVHLVLCKWCRRYGRQITFIHETAGSRPDEMAKIPSQQLSDEAKKRIKLKLTR
jgi:hypothetical protein